MKMRGIRLFLVIAAAVGTALLAAMMLSDDGLDRQRLGLPNTASPEPETQNVSRSESGPEEAAHALLSDPHGATEAALAHSETTVSQASAPSPTTESPDLPGVSDREVTLAIYAAEAERICRAQDAVMQGWPSYLAIRDQLCAALAQRLDLENMETAELVDAAVRLREEFWRLGGNLSNNSYQDGYSARILLELAHDREPRNMAIADELVEAMQAVEVSWSYVRQEDGTYRKARNNDLAQAILELRRAQFERVQEEVRRGRTPTWEDFVRANDLPLLLGKLVQFDAARDVVEWEIQHADRGGWTAYLGPLKRSLGVLAQQDVHEFNIYWARHSSYAEEYKYARRLPSFKGAQPDKRGVVPVHELSAHPVWRSATQDTDS